MLKEVVRAMETGLLAEIGLFAFVLAFVLILIRVFFIPKKEREAAKRIPLDEPAELDPTQK